MPDAAIVVVNFGSHRLLDRNLAGVGSTARVVVVDNFSDAGERVAVTSLARSRGWELVAMAGNPGFGAGVNAGVRHAVAGGARTLLVLNPDAIVDAATVRALAEHVSERPDELVSPRIVDSTGATWFAGSEIVLRTGYLQHLHGGPPGAEVQAWLSAACLAMSATAFDRLDGFDERYFLYWEDVDLSFRAAALGLGLVVRDDLSAVHDEGGTHGRSYEPSTPAKSALYYRWNARNRLVFAARNLPTRLLVGWLLATPAQSWQILLRGGRRQLVQSPRPLAAITAGSAAGIGVALRELLRRMVRR